MNIEDQNKEFEIRQFEIRAVEVQADQETRVIRGTAIVFNSTSQDLGGWVEEILPEAVSTEFLNSQDIVMLYEHSDKQGILARSKFGKGTLKYSIDEVGVHFEFTAKNTALGNEILEAVKAGDLDACSFSFRVAEGGQKWENIGENMYKRTITKFECIRDFSIVLNPAYTATEVNNRSLEAYKESELQQLLKVDEERQAQEQEKISNYYQDLKTELRNLNINI